MKNIKNVLLINQSAELYGSDKVLLHIVRALRDSGIYHPIVILPTEGELRTSLCDLGVETHVAPVGKISRSSFSPAGIYKLAQELLASGSRFDAAIAGRDIYLVHSNTLSVLSGGIWSRRRGVMHIWHVHEIIRSPPLARPIYALLLRILADKVIFVSTAVRDWLAAGSVEIREKSTLVFNGTSEIDADLTRGSFRREIGLTEENLLVTLAGRINSWKGQRVLVDAARHLRSMCNLDKIKFVIVGDTVGGQEDLKEQLQHYIRISGLADYFVLLPFVKNIDRVWLDTDIAVVPSTEPEPFGMVAIEAMAAGVPVVASAHGGLLDIVEHGQSGFLFRPSDPEDLADYLKLLIEDRDLRYRLGLSGRERQSRLFSLGSQAEALMNCYME